MGSEREETVSPTNKVSPLVLDFGTSSRSDLLKCKEFWKYIDSHPHLEKLKVLGRKQLKDVSEERCGVHKPSTPPQHSTQPPRRMWTELLEYYKKIGLDKIVLDALPTDPTYDRIPTDPLREDLDHPSDVFAELQKFDIKEHTEEELEKLLQVYKYPVTMEKFLEERRKRKACAKVSSVNENSEEESDTDNV